jgi:ATP-dependent RNA helicase DeaD
VLAQDEARMWEDAALDETATAQERAAAARLVERFGAERLALAYLRSRARGLPAPEVLIGPASDTVRVSRPKVTDGVWFALNCGREGKAEVRWILPLICRLGRVTKTEIGRIVVRERETRFEISARAADAFAAAVAKATEAGVEIRRATAPEDDRPARGIWGEGRPAD